MADKNFHRFPEPKDDVSGRRNVNPASFSIRRIAGLWRPAGSLLEPVISTLARFAHRLVSSDGNAYTADELEAKILAQSSGTSEALPDTLVLRDDNGSAEFDAVTLGNTTVYNRSGITRTYYNGTFSMRTPINIGAAADTEIICYFPRESGTLALTNDIVAPLVLAEPPATFSVTSENPNPIDGGYTQTTDGLYGKQYQRLELVGGLPIFLGVLEDGRWGFEIDGGVEVASVDSDKAEPWQVEEWNDSTVIVSQSAAKLGQHAIVNETDVYVCVREEPVKWEKVLIDDGELTASVINVIASNGMSGLLHLHGDGGYNVTLLAPIELTADREQFTPDADGAIGVLRVFPNSGAANAAVSVGDAWWDNTLNKVRVRLS